MNDRPILRTAIESKADVLLTGDKDFLTSRSPAGQRTDFLERQYRALSYKSGCRSSVFKIIRKQLSFTYIFLAILHHLST